jgi:CDP-glycerol glycerophosphotransferase (TagB/SpsB family)
MGYWILLRRWSSYPHNADPVNTNKTSIEINRLGLNVGDAVYISPFTPISENLKRQILQTGEIEFLGFIDSHKVGENIIKPDQVGARPFTKTLIMSPNYGIDIFKKLKTIGISSSKLELVIFSRGYTKISLLNLRWKKFKGNLLPSIHLLLQRLLQKYIQRSDTILFLSQDFIDLNTKQLYLYFMEKPEFKTAIATDNKQQIAQFRKSGFRVLDVHSLSFVFFSLRAKLKILDHNPVSKNLLCSIQGSKTIQMWHGIPLKKIGHLANYKMTQYDVMISTSDFVTGYAFSKVFDYKKIINAGYARTDLLVKPSDTDKSLVMVEHAIYEWVKNTDKSVVIYMPTWRSDSFDNNPIDLDKLNEFAKINSLIIVIKMHPFVRPDSFFDTLESERYLFNQDYQNSIVFYPSVNDIYPLLSISSLLITDY